MSVSVICPCDHVADLELGLTAIAKHHKSIVLNIAGPKENQNSKHGFYCVLLLHHCEVEKTK